MSDSTNTPENPLLELYKPGLIKLVELESAVHHLQDARQKEGKQLTPEDVEALKNAHDDYADLLHPLMVSMVGPKPEELSTAAFESMPDPMELIKLLPKDFLWLALTKFLCRVRSAISDGYRPVRKNTVSGDMSEGNAVLFQELASALSNALGADVSMKIVRGKDVIEKGIDGAMNDAPTFEAEPRDKPPGEEPTGDAGNVFPSDE